VLVEAREHHPFWGAKKLLALLSRRHPEGAWPARPTVCDILDRHGLVNKLRDMPQKIISDVPRKCFSVDP